MTRRYLFNAMHNDNMHIVLVECSIERDECKNFYMPQDINFLPCFLFLARCNSVTCVCLWLSEWVH